MRRSVAGHSYVSWGGGVGCSGGQTRGGSTELSVMDIVFGQAPLDQNARTCEGEIEDNPDPTVAHKRAKHTKLQNKKREATECEKEPGQDRAGAGKRGK